MTYRPSSVGNTFIDLDHCNLFGLLDLCRAGIDRDAILRRLVSELKKHIVHEEAIIGSLGVPFPEDHAADHMEMLLYLSELRTSWMVSETSDHTYIQEFQRVLTRHIDSHDARFIYIEGITGAKKNKGR